MAVERSGLWAPGMTDLFSLVYVQWLHFFCFFFVLHLHHVQFLLLSNVNLDLALSRRSNLYFE